MSVRISFNFPQETLQNPNAFLTVRDYVTFLAELGISNFIFPVYNARTLARPLRSLEAPIAHNIPDCSLLSMIRERN